jgi:hypothetical protein
MAERDQLEQQINSLPPNDATGKLPLGKDLPQQRVHNTAPRQAVQRLWFGRVPLKQSTFGRVQQIQSSFSWQWKRCCIFLALLIPFFFLIGCQLPRFSTAPRCSLCDISSIPFLNRALSLFQAPNLVKTEIILPPLRLLHEILPNNSLIIMPHQLWLIADNLTRYENAVLFSGLHSEEMPFTAGESSNFQKPGRVCEQIRVVRNSTRAVAAQIERWGADAHRFNRDVARVIQHISHQLQDLIAERRSLMELIGWSTVSQDHKDIWIRFFQNLYEDAGNLDQVMQSVIATLDILDSKKNQLLESTAQQIAFIKAGLNKVRPAYYHWGQARVDKKEKVAKLEEQELLLRSLANHVVEARNVADRISRILSSIKHEIKHTQDLLSNPVGLLEAKSPEGPLNWKVELAEQIEKISQENQKLDEFERRQMAEFEAYVQHLAVERRKFEQDTGASSESSRNVRDKSLTYGLSQRLWKVYEGASQTVNSAMWVWNMAMAYEKFSRRGDRGSLTGSEGRPNQRNFPEHGFLVWCWDVISAKLAVHGTEERSREELPQRETTQKFSPEQVNGHSLESMCSTLPRWRFLYP